MKDTIISFISFVLVYLIILITTAILVFLFWAVKEAIIFNYWGPLLGLSAIVIWISAVFSVYYAIKR